MSVKYIELTRNKSMKSVSYLAILTTDPDEAARFYEEKIGSKPTVLLVRPDFALTNGHPFLVRSRFAAWGLILVSHLIKPSEIEDAEPTMVYHDRDIDLSTIVDLKNETNLSIPKKEPGRPARPKSECPHCHNQIKSWENLGYWYGWSFGIIPPYWDELSHYVFGRDDYVCQKCGKRFPFVLLTAHHIHAKEDGGEDGARNLQTLCHNCHLDTKPIFEDSEDDQYTESSKVIK